MKRALTALAALSLFASAAIAADAPEVAKAAAPHFQPTEVSSEGSVRVGGNRIDYRAVAGTLVVHPKGWDDVASEFDKDEPKAEASMFYVAYFKKGAEPGSRPITFLFNGGPGSASLWLHMGAFGPRRVVTADDTHTPPAPYPVVNNGESLLDVSDLVFIDAPGTGFSRIAGKDAEKAFYGVDQDVHAFAAFIRDFLSRYHRWNTPKYLLGESYGTMRAAALSYALQDEMDIDLNGVVLISQVLNWDAYPDEPEQNPGIDLPYQLALPSYAATAWYYHKLPNRPADLPAFLREVEQFAMTDYALALLQGNSLPPERARAIAERLHAYTGLSVPYILKARLRIPYGPFQHELLNDEGRSTGSLDTRFAGPSMDPLSKSVAYDPGSAAISSAYVAAFNAYVRRELRYGGETVYRTGGPIYGKWDFKHQPPGSGEPIKALPNVMPDLAAAMKRNPDMKVMLNGGWFDVVTPYFEGWYEMHHLPIPPELMANIGFHYYPSGHMIYAHEPSLEALHDNIAAFIRGSAKTR